MVHTAIRQTDRKPGAALATAMCLIVSTWLAGEACAVPACPAPVTVAQPDGRKIEIRLKGDEFLHWHEDAAGFTILKDPKTRRWMYAARAAHGGLVPGSLVVGKDDSTVSGEPRHMLPDGAVARASADARDRDEQSAVADGPSVAAGGAIKNLVVLVEFPDLAGTHTKAEFEALFNTVGYNTDGAKGSVKDYYNEVSYNSIDMDSVVTDWITLDRKYSFYGRNDVSGDDARPREMVQEALAKLEASGFDFSALDADNDGWVDGLTIMHSGRGEEYAGNDPNYIWSHKWQMISTVTYDGKKMLEYHTEPEIRGWDDTPSTWGICRIGVICHETGHFLGLPDLYDYDYDSKGVGDFCLMAGGSWNGSYGTLPAHMSAWCKKELGWVTPTVVSSNGTYTVPRVEDNPAVFRLGGPFPSSQYFLVENRQGYGFDVGMPGITRGLLIWHIDETRPDNDDQTHYLVDLEEAGGTQHLELDQNDGDDSDYYRAGHNTSFTADTTPNNLSYSGTPLGLNIVSVSASGSSMTFTVGAPPQPLDHFDWAAVASPQAVDAPFAVTVTAKDSAGAIATGFTGSVALSGAVGTVGEVTIGGATSTWEQPMSTLFEDARTQVIYLAEEVGGPCAIEALSLYVTVAPGQTMKNWTIRMKHTALSDYPTTPSWEASGWATVYQNDETVSSTGWVTFTFAAPFDYDGVQNLMIDFSYNNSTWSDNGLCRYSTTGQYRSIYYETDSSYGDPLTWSGTGSPAPDRSVNFPNIKLGLSGNQVAISPTVSGNFAGGVWTGQVMVLEEAAGMYLRAIDGSGSAGSSNTFDVQQLEQTHTLTVQTWPITGVSITGDKPGTTDYTAPCDDQKVVNLTAPPTVTVGALRYDFERWYGGSPAGQNVQVTMDGDKTLVAEYIMRRHALTVQSSPITGISIAGDKPGTTDYTVLCDDQEVVNLTAPAKVTVGALRYDFVQWTGDGSPAGQNVLVTMDGDKTLVAEYILRRHTLTVQSSPITGVSIAGDKPGTTNYTVPCDDQEVVNLTAPPSVMETVEYSFNFWVVDGVDQPPRQADLQITMDADHLADALYGLAGDVNGDCTVNILDLIGARNHLQTPVATDDNWRYDVNGDNVINVLDLIMVRNYLRITCPL